MAAGPGDAGAAAAASAASRAPSSEAGIFSAISAARSPSGPAAGVGAGVGSAAATGVSTGVGAGAGASGRAMTGPVGSGGISARGTLGTGAGASSSLGIAFLVRAVVLRLGGSSTTAGAGSSARLPRVLRRGGSPDISYPLSRTYSRIAPSVGWTGFAASSSCWAPAFERRAFSSFCFLTAS